MAVRTTSGQGMSRDATPALHLSSCRGPKKPCFGSVGGIRAAGGTLDPRAQSWLQGAQHTAQVWLHTQLEQLEIPQTERRAANPAPIAPGRVSLPLTAHFSLTMQIRGCRSTRCVFPKEFVHKEIARQGGFWHFSFLSDPTDQPNKQSAIHCG